MIVLLYPRLRASAGSFVAEAAEYSPVEAHDGEIG